MLTVIGGASFVGALLLLAVVGLAWRLVSVTQVRGVDPDWIWKFSIETYRPMERLLSEDDIRFLRRQPGYVPGMERALRAQRRRIFRAYLRDLGRDFNRLHLTLRLLVLQSTEDHPELAKALVKQKLIFFTALTAVHLRLQLRAWGIGSVDVRGLVEMLEQLRAELQRLMPLPVAQPVF